MLGIGSICNGNGTSLMPGVRAQLNGAVAVIGNIAYSTTKCACNVSSMGTMSWPSLRRNYLNRTISVCSFLTKSV